MEGPVKTESKDNSFIYHVLAFYHHFIFSISNILVFSQRKPSPDRSCVRDADQYQPRVIASLLVQSCTTFKYTSMGWILCQIVLRSHSELYSFYQRNRHLQ